MVFFLVPFLPVFIIFYIGCIAETNRAPFDLAEAESELVSGFMTEHSAVIFVFFFLAEYASIVLICILTSLLFLGGYISIFSLYSVVENPFLLAINSSVYCDYFSYHAEMEYNLASVLYNAFASSLSLGIKSSFMIFVFI